MQLHFVPYLWLSLTMLVLMALLTGYTWKRRSVRGVPFFMLSAILVTVWIAAQAMEIASVSLSAKIIWANIQYIPIYLIPVTYLYLTLQYVGFDRWLKARWLPIALLAVPVAANVLFWTNGMHGLMRQNIYLDESGAFSAVGKTYGPLFWVFSTYDFVVSLASLLVLSEGLSQRTDLHKRQSSALFLGLLLPVCSVAMFILKVIHTSVDPTPIVIGFSGLIIFWGIFRYRLFDIVKIAYSMIIHEMSAGLIIIDPEGGVLEINPAAREMLGITLQKPVGVRIQALLQDFPQLKKLYEGRTNRIEEVVLKNDKGRNYYEVSLKKLQNAAGSHLGWIMQIYNITKRKLEEETIRHMASHDALTGLLNRGHFQRMFSEELTHAKITGSVFSVAYLDLDDFKQINDTYGHEVGDEYLRVVAERLNEALRESDIIARYGGDEYIILFPSVGEDENLELISEKIYSVFEKGFTYNNLFLQIRASIGFSVYPRDGSSLDTLIDKADKAMYSIKATQKNSAFIYHG